MEWRELKWILLALLILLFHAPWSTLIGSAREEAKKSRSKDVL